jgi:hypothetical protein
MFSGEEEYHLLVGPCFCIALQDYTYLAAYDGGVGQEMNLVFGNSLTCSTQFGIMSQSKN